MMRLLLTAYIIGLIVPQLEAFASSYIRYVPTLFCVALLIFLKDKTLSIARKDVRNTLFGVFIIGAIASVVANFNPLSAAYVIFMPINLLMYDYIRRYKLRRIHILLILAVLLIPVIFPYYNAGGYTGLYRNPNGLAAVAMFVAYLSLCLHDSKRLYVKGKWRISLQTIAILFGGGYIVVLTGSRAGQVGYIVFCLAYLIQRLVNYNFKVLQFLGLCIAISVYIWMIQTRTLTLIEAANSATDSEKLAGFSHRDELYDIFIEVIKTDPFGVGLGLSGDYYKEVSGSGQNYSPHNTYLKTAAEGGWLFFIGYALLLVYFMLKTNSILANSFILGYGVRNLFESATPFTMSLVSALLFLPFFLNEYAILPKEGLHPHRSK